MKITIDFIPHLEQRYNTCGDWVFDQNGDLAIHVSETENWKWNSCVALHELVEALCCKANGVTTDVVDAFDINWKPFGSFEEPGEDPRAPYFAEHATAVLHEQQLFDFMFEGAEPVEWEMYEAKLMELMKSHE
jgi:hypothetical protein